jgi:medium-chain acyl-[acyl-carrier-protein] hydrolase
MRPWARETRSGFHLRQFEGGHFYFLGPAFVGFTRELVREIEPYAEAPAAR